MKRILLANLLIILTVTCKSQEYKYLVMKGGGIRGIAYAGAINVLEEKHLLQHFEKVAGTSVGAITATMICMGYTASQIETVMYSLDLATFNDGQGFFIGGQHRFRKRFGWYRGKRLEQWIGDMIKQQTGNENITFSELHKLTKENPRYKDLYVLVTNLSKQNLMIFSWENYPDVVVKDAVRASISIPLYYTAMFMDTTGNISTRQSTGNEDILIDGGLLANYPIEVFNSHEDSVNHLINANTLGLKLERPEQINYAVTQTGIAPFQIRSLPNYIGALYNLTIEQLNKNIPHEIEEKNTIYISTSNINPRVRHITREQKQLLFNNGAVATRAFFERR